MLASKDIVGITGTTIRDSQGVQHGFTEDHFVWTWGWKPSRCTNNSCGLTLLLKKKRFPKPRVRAILPVWKDLHGRVGGMALRGPEHFVFVLMLCGINSSFARWMLMFLVSSMIVTSCTTHVWRSSRRSVTRSGSGVQVHHSRRLDVVGVSALLPEVFASWEARLEGGGRPALSRPADWAVPRALCSSAEKEP